MNRGGQVNKENPTKGSLLRRYSAYSIGLHCLYWPVFGGLQSFTTILLLDRGFNNTLIGLLVALGSITAVVVQQPVAAFADRSRKVELNQLICLICGLLLPMVLFILLDLPAVLGLVGVAFVIYYAGIMMMQSLLNALGMELINRDYPVNYGRARGFGCLLAATSVWLLALLGDGAVHGMLLLSVIFLALLLVLTATLRMPPRKEEAAFLKAPAAAKSSIFSLFRKYRYFALLCVGAILNLSSFYIGGIYLIHVVAPFGGGSTEVGIAMAISGFAEAIPMYLFARVARRIRVLTLFRFSVLMIPLKPITFALAQSVGYAYFAQIFHVFGVALFFTSSVYYVNYIMSSEDRAQGQSIMVAVTLLSMVLASVLGGWGVDGIGITSTLWIGNVLAVLGGLVVFFTAGKIVPKGVDPFRIADDDLPLKP